MEKPGFRSGAKNLVDERPKARRFNLVKTWQLGHCYPGGAGSSSPVGGEITPRIAGGELPPSTVKRLHLFEGLFKKTPVKPMWS